MLDFGCCIAGGSFMPQGDSKTNVNVYETLLNSTKYITNCGYSFSEVGASFLAQLSEDDLLKLSTLSKKGKFPLKACNSFIPGSLSLMEESNDSKVEEYVNLIIERAAMLGIEIIVFGSGVARNIPDSMTTEKGMERIHKFLHLCNKIAEKHSVTIALEPLNKSECNIINTVSEGAQIVRLLNLPKIKLLADCYHMYCENEDFEILEKVSDILVHVHIAETPKRTSPGCEGGGYVASFLDFLKKSGYNGRVSIECGFNDFEKEIVSSYKFLKEITKMDIKFNARRSVTAEPIYVKTENMVESCCSAVDQDGKIFPAQPQGNGVIIVADTVAHKDINATLSNEKICGGVEIKYSEDKKALDVYISGKIFTSYVFGRGYLKPYLGPINTADGNSYTRLDLETKEHPHQRSIIFAVGDVNGIDFWNEDQENRGQQRHQSIDEIISGSAFGSFSATNVWCDHKGNPVLDEKRKYTFYNQPNNCRCVDTEVTFSANYGDVKFGATKEAGPLGIRVNEEMRADATGSFTNSYGAENEQECWGRSASWCNYSGMIDGKKYGIAVFDNENNERYPTAWHIRDYGLFAANNLYFKGGLDIPHHYSLTYKFRIYFYENDFDATNRFMMYCK